MLCNRMRTRDIVSPPYGSVLASLLQLAAPGAGGNRTEFPTSCWGVREKVPRFPPSQDLECARSYFNPCFSSDRKSVAA